VEAYLHAFLASALEGCEWSASRFGRFNLVTTGKEAEVGWVTGLVWAQRCLMELLATCQPVKLLGYNNPQPVVICVGTKVKLPLCLNKYHAKNSHSLLN